MAPVPSSSELLPTGGTLPAHWVAELAAAADAGLDVVSGLHTRLTSFPDLVQAASRRGVRLIDVRHSDRTYGAATRRKRSGKRVLTVGTDCALGKKYTALALAKNLRESAGSTRPFEQPARPAS